MERLQELAREHTLPAAAPEQLDLLLRLLAQSPHALTSVRDPDRAVEVHIADSLSGLSAPELRSTLQIADLGSGGGFPGLVLAVALPQARVTLVESVSKKAEFLREAAIAMDLRNVAVVVARAEAWPEGLGASGAVTARALAPLGVLLEYAAPLLHQGGALVAWKGRRDDAEESVAVRAALELGMSRPEYRPLASGEAERHLCLSTKESPTPDRYPRRTGVAHKRPLGA
ncbi:unannotated protein [freshwater metagenome]|uniref:Unannotated protein n=1 Tax=freshwater metagenome TaxID=449393 RepID=A0A6J7CN52_9ZZZZ